MKKFHVPWNSVMAKEVKKFDRELLCIVMAYSHMYLGEGCLEKDFKQKIGVFLCLSSSDHYKNCSNFQDFK